MNYILLVKLLLAHVLGDFVLQWKGLCDAKQDLSKLKGWGAQMLHALIQAGFAYILVTDWTSWIIPMVVFSSHLLIDVLKSWLCKEDDVWPFVFDQLAHVAVIIALSFIFVDTVQCFLIEIKYLVMLLAYILMTSPTSIFISKFYNQWNNKEEEDNKVANKVDYKDGSGSNQTPPSLPRGGEFIGKLERVLLLTFIFVGYPEGIGFLLAAKSIFRFGDLQQSGELKLTEYVLIGTFLSFAIAVLVGYGALKLIKILKVQ